MGQSVSAVNRVIHSATTLGNVAEVIGRVVNSIAGNDISTTINGSKANSDMVTTMVLQRIKSNLDKRSAV